jgi:hypothetical protein
MVGFLGYMIQRTGFSPLEGVPVIDRFRGDSSGATQHVKPASGPSEPTVTIVLQDPVTGERLDSDEQVHIQRVEIPGARQGSSTQRRTRGARATRRTHEQQSRQSQDGTRSGRVTLRDGYAEVNLPQGQWEITLGGLFETTSTVSVRKDTEVVLEPDPQFLSVQVNDSLTGEGLRDTHVTVTPDVGDSQSGHVQDSSVTVQLSPRARRANVTVDHDRYDSTSEEITLQRGETQQVTLTLAPKTGTITPTVLVDGKPASGVRVESKAIDQRTRQYQRHPITGMTDERGQSTLQNCIVGEYDVTAAVDESGRFTVPTSRITVESGSTSKVKLELSFDFQLSGQQRERIERMNERLSNLTSVTGRDTAIPEYYGSVVQELLEMIQRTPKLGHLFVTSELDPVRLVDALLDQAGTVVEQIATAMSSKRNTDLFTASRDLPAYGGGWSGQFDPDRLIELWGRDPTEARRLIVDRLDDIEERIRTEQTELASVAPAREPWELAREHVGKEHVENAVRATAMAFVYEGYLDAIERLFDDPELRERLERTVF